MLTISKDGLLATCTASSGCQWSHPSLPAPPPPLTDAPVTMVEPSCTPPVVYRYPLRGTNQGRLPEWSMGTVCKTVARATLVRTQHLPRVRREALTWTVGQSLFAHLSDCVSPNSAVARRSGAIGGGFAIFRVDLGLARGRWPVHRTHESTRAGAVWPP